MNITWIFFKSQLGERELGGYNTIKSNSFGILQGMGCEATQSIFINIIVLRTFRELTRVMSHEIMHFAARNCYSDRSVIVRKGEEKVITSLEFGGYFG